MQCLLTGKDKIILAWKSTRIMTTKTSIYTWQITSQNTWNVLNNQIQRNPNTKRAGGLYQPMFNTYKWCENYIPVLLFGKKDTKFIQYVIETLIYYARSIDPIMLRVIN